MDSRDEQDLRSAALQNAQSIFAARQRSEETLRRSESQFRQLADSLPQIVWAAKADGVVDYFNERWYEFTGFPRDLRGEDNLARILHPDDVQPTLDRYHDCVRTGELFQ